MSRADTDHDYGLGRVADVGHGGHGGEETHSLECQNQGDKNTTLTQV